MSINIDKSLWKAAMGENLWPDNIRPFSYWSIDITGTSTNDTSTWIRFWPTTKFMTIVTAKGASNNNRCKAYLLSFKSFDFGSYQQKAYISGREGTRLLYPLMFETPIGGWAVPPPTGDKAGGAFFYIDTSTTKAYTGYDGSSTNTTFTGWDPTVEATLKIEWTATYVKYYVDGALKVTHSSYVPQYPLPYCLELRQDAQAAEYADAALLWFRDFAEV